MALRVLSVSVVALAIWFRVAWSDQLVAPYAVAYQADGDSLCLVWHYPGVNIDSITSTSLPPDSYAFCASTDVGGRVAVRLELAPEASAIERIAVRLWPSDPFPSLPGDRFSPFVMALRHRLDLPALWESTVVCPSEVTGDDWFNVPVCVGSEKTETLYWELRWLPETPAAPLLTVSYTTFVDGQFLGHNSAGSIVWQPVTDMAFHARIIYSICDTLQSAADDSTLPDSFSVFALTPPNEGGVPDDYRTGTTTALHCVLPRSQLEGKFLTVAAWSGDTLGPKSAALFVDAATGVDDCRSLLPETSLLSQNFPNPFNQETTLISRLHGELQILDILGREVRRLQPSLTGTDTFVFQWDGRDDSGHPVASGVYFARQDGAAEVRRIILLK